MSDGGLGFGVTHCRLPSGGHTSASVSALAWLHSRPTLRRDVSSGARQHATALCLLHCGGLSHSAAALPVPGWPPLCLPPKQVTAAASAMLEDVVAVAARDGLVAQSYWLATTLALGAFLKVRAAAQREAHPVPRYHVLFCDG